MIAKQIFLENTIATDNASYEKPEISLSEIKPAQNDSNNTDEGGKAFKEIMAESQNADDSSKLNRENKEKDVSNQDVYIEKSTIKKDASSKGKVNSEDGTELKPLVTESVTETTMLESDSLLKAKLENAEKTENVDDATTTASTVSAENKENSEQPQQQEHVKNNDIILVDKTHNKINLEAVEQTDQKSKLTDEHKDLDDNEKILSWLDNLMVTAISSGTDNDGKFSSTNINNTQEKQVLDEGVSNIIPPSLDDTETVTDDSVAETMVDEAPDYINPEYINQKNAAQIVLATDNPEYNLSSLGALKQSIESDKQSFSADEQAHEDVINHRKNASESAFLASQIQSAINIKPEQVTTASASLNTSVENRFINLSNQGFKTGDYASESADELSAEQLLETDLLKQRLSESASNPFSTQGGLNPIKLMSSSVANELQGLKETTGDKIEVAGVQIDKILVPPKVENAAQNRNELLIRENILFNKQELANNLQQQIGIMLSRNLKSVDVRLDPPELGAMQVKLSVNNEQAAVNFVVSNSMTKDALEASMPRLKELLEQQGLQLGNADVKQQSSQQGDNMNSDEQANPETEGGARLNAEDELLTEQSEALNRQMNSPWKVDYFA